jgi:hypothetical protein
MEHQLWSSIVAALAGVHKARKRTICDFSDEDIVKVHYWSVIHDRPTRWACASNNWPLQHRRRALPSPSTMSRRLRSRSVCALLERLEQRVIAPQRPGLFWMIDGKPLPIGGCSKDRQAGYGRAAQCKAKGYKMHAVVGSDGSIAAWRIAPMNKDERVMAERMLRTAPIQGYVIGDSNFDSNKVHRVCDDRGDLQLLAPRRYGREAGLGHRKHAAGRLRAIELLENPSPAFGRQLLRERAAIERHFARLTNWGGSLTCLPPWVRTHRRVRRWVQAKLVLTALKAPERTTTCAA